jgi:hypothetical protein
MSDASTFPILILLGRPAAGKSEIMAYLRATPLDERVRRFRVGEFAEIDDFPLLWAWFEEDEILTRMGRPRLHSTPDSYFLRRYFWDVLIRRLNVEYAKWLRDHPTGSTAIGEFSRGSEHGGYRAALPNLSDEILSRAAVLYINVSWEESLRKNRRRFNPDRPDSILQHGLDDEKLDRLYREVDWPQVSAGDPRYLSVRGHRVPYVVFENKDDVTTDRGPALGERLQETLGRLWDLRNGDLSGS